MDIQQDLRQETRRGARLKTAVITGASGGIGSAMALTFARAGYKTALCCNHSADKAEALAAAIRAEGGTAEVFSFDLAQERQVREAFQKIDSSFGTVDALINNAGVASQELLTDVTDDLFDRIVDTNLKGTFHCCRAVLPGMIHEKSGSILNISSMWGQVGGSCEVIYSASKAGIIGLTKALAKEVGPSGIRVNCIAPGVIDTAMNSMHSADTMAELADETPLQRIGTPEEVARAALFLSSDAAAFITGQVLGVNGGMVI